MQNISEIDLINDYNEYSANKCKFQNDYCKRVYSNEKVAKTTTTTRKRLRRRGIASRKIKQHNFLILFGVFAFVILTILSPQISAHSCSYQVPEAEDIILNVPFTVDDSSQQNMRHTKRDLDQDSSKKKAQHRVRRNFAANRDFRPLRISLYFDPASINPLSVEKQIFINSSLLPQAIGFWEQALLARPTEAPIRLSRKCKSNHYYLDASETHPTCVDRCKASTTCGEVAIPDEHLFCRYCALPNPLSCTFSGPPNGAGVNNADFLLYVSAVNSQRCQNEDTIAYAAHCQQEADLDRPIAGHVNICPNALSTHLHDQEILLSTVKHEILHALGFSAGLYAFFRHPDGRPRTKRNRYNRPLIFNRERGYYDADESTIRTIERTNWWTAESQITHSVHVMVTEKVAEEARLHFNCSGLEGAELENQGGDGTALTHWEKRLFENEAMTGTHTQNPVYSRLTLALMEDSGWYKANYSVAEHLHWGKNLGCDFAMKSCGEWIKNRLEKNLSTAPFCHQIKHDGHKSLATTRCTDQRDSLALCNLIPYKKALPIDYRNFLYLKGVHKEGIKYYGGSVELADFCPYNQEFEWKSMNSTDRRRDSRCELRGNAPPLESNHVMEVYGNRSKCFDLAVSWTERKCGRAKTYTQFMAGCYQFVCKNGRLNLKIFDTTTLYPCYYAGQPIHIRRIVNGWLREGIIECPPCEEICSAEHFWHSSYQSTLLQETSTIRSDYFDTPTTQNINSVDDEDDLLTTEDNSLLTIDPNILLTNQIQRRRVREDIFSSLDLLSGPIQCAPDMSKEDIVVEIGDPPLNEPCFGVRLKMHISTLLAFAFTLIASMLIV